jgi:hypothetical protein
MSTKIWNPTAVAYDTFPTGNLITGDGSIETIVALTQAAYDAIVTPDPTTWYVITDAIDDPISASDVGFTPVGTISSTNVQAALAELDAEKLSALTPWTEDIDADGFTLTSLGAVEIGPAASATVANLNLDLDATTTTGASLSGMNLASTATFNTVAGGSYYGVNATPTISGNANLAAIYGLRFSPTINSAITTTAGYGIYGELNHGIGTMTTGTAVYAKIAESFGTMTTGIGVDIATTSAGGTFTTAIGLRITNLAGGTTKWGFQVGAYQSYHEGTLRVGAVSAGSTAAPVAQLDVINPFPSLGQDPMRITSVTTGDDVTETVRQNRVATTNATPTFITSVTIPASTTVMIESRTVGRRTGGASGVAEDGVGFIHTSTWKNVAGTATQIGTTTAMHSNESQAGCDVTHTAASGTVEVRVVGIATTNMTWHTTVRFYAVSS